MEEDDPFSFCAAAHLVAPIFNFETQLSLSSKSQKLIFIPTAKACSFRMGFNIFIFYFITKVSFAHIKFVPHVSPNKAQSQIPHRTRKQFYFPINQTLIHVASLVNT